MITSGRGMKWSAMPGHTRTNTNRNEGEGRSWKHGEGEKQGNRGKGKHTGVLAQTMSDETQEPILLNASVLD